MRGFSDDGQSVYVNDPDTQAPRWAGWIPGGQITLAYGTFRQAAYEAAPGPYGIIVGNGVSRGSPPPTPGGLAITGATAHGLTLGWQASSGASGYKVYRWAWAQNRWDFFYLATTSSTSYTQDGLDCANSFNYYLVTAFNSAGESPQSGWVQGNTQACTLGIAEPTAQDPAQIGNPPPPSVSTPEPTPPTPVPPVTPPKQFIYMPLVQR